MEPYRCVFVEGTPSCSLMLLGISSSPTTGWMDTLNWSSLVLRGTTGTGNTHVFIGYPIKQEANIYIWKLAACVESLKSIPMETVTEASGSSRSEEEEKKEIVSDKGTVCNARKDGAKREEEVE
ncbi:hypothetical protein EYF80_032779 [Liparis tanakae]|uniref:Uncharacterized protein n=1 Tax=Liparis tanakae TaxID=230148 RepID=A0A4Z2GU65_9TELE|nr:hypothetical protein EYF80_032779 [Liparis tanakae]